MPPYGRIFQEIVLPVVVLFAVERFLVYRYIRTPAQRAFVRRTRWLRPNNISRLRYPMGFVTVALLEAGWPRAAFLFFAFWMITDLTDGDIARRTGLSSARGATIDPLSDKLMYAPLLVYFAWKGVYSPWLVAALLGFDALGQFSRRFLEEKSANLFGKAKTFLIVVLLAVTGVEWIYGPLPLHRTIRPLLVICTGLAFCSWAFKVVPNYWYANILSLLNLVCGLGGIWVIVTGRDPVYAFGLVFLGQFLDLFDGRAAEKWGSTPRGEIFDDVADGTSFGVTVGLIVATAFDRVWLGVGLGFVHLAATVYRLIRFVVEKRKEGVAGGVHEFSGLPSPGGALLVGSGCLLLPSDGWKAAVVLASAALMVSRVSYAHFGRAVLPRTPKLLRVGFLALFLLLLAQGVRTDEYGAPLAISFAAAVIYVASPVFRRIGGRPARESRGAP
ncbi:CDP-alcohol phosphatidyltransferase family protein [Deferrisoma camini]|uniref:CDP-alcohol phosphatidyltransferase family protein n=1 Tax=Deferrisoma camini TaxID=1035120 RepID=UPI00046CC703|nr:CDP-alcohol phosphatidyltransferase family protein [Deferrisoma camini]